MLALIAGGETAEAQIVVVADTVEICAGSEHLGITFGRDSLLVVDTLAADSFRAVWVRVLPEYRWIRDTTLARGGWLLGKQFWQIGSVNEFGQTAAGCDSNTTWVVHFPRDEAEVLPKLDWQCRVFPNPTVDERLWLETLPRLSGQVAKAWAGLRIFDSAGRQVRVFEAEKIENWSPGAGLARLRAVDFSGLPSGWFWLEVVLDGGRFGFSVVKFD